MLWKGIDQSAHHYALAVQRPNESNPLGVCCDIVKPVFSTTLYDAAPVRERDVVRQPIDRSTLHWRSLVTWRGVIRRMGADAAGAGAVVRKPPVKETAMGERVAVTRALTYQNLTVVAAIRQHNFCVMARKLRLVENDFGILCSFNELRVVKIPHISTSTLYTSRRPLYHIG